jgi:nitrogen fixation NifU-like protein
MCELPISPEGLVAPFLFPLRQKEGVPGTRTLRDDERMYSERLMTLFRGATHAGELPGETHRGVAGTPGCGPYIVLGLRVEDGVVRQARFRTYGCPAAMACAEVVCAVSEGRPLALLQALTAADVNHLVGGVPDGKEHCPELAAQALARAAGAAPAEALPQ